MKKALLLGTLVAFVAALDTSAQQLPKARMNSIFPAGGQQGTSVDVTITGGGTAAAAAAAAAPCGDQKRARDPVDAPPVEILEISGYGERTDGSSYPDMTNAPRRCSHIRI